MPDTTPFQHISEPPTNPLAKKGSKLFDVADLYTGPAETSPTASKSETGLDERLRQAYFWIINHAIISPHYDIEYFDGPFQSYVFGDSKTRLNLPSGQSYSSFILIPLLNFAVRRHCLLIGGPGRGKTSSAILMGILAGYSLKEIHRAMIHGQPQMTVADLLGTPLPVDMINAQSIEDVRISWRQWLPMRVKIIDEYNRIPTRTQSSLLTVMADNYAELLNHVYECPTAAWYLTANDDSGGGTYAVIEALRDRIDIVVKSLHFNNRFLNELLTRVEEKIEPAEIVPSQIHFSQSEIDQMNNDILAIEFPLEIRRRLEFFASQFEFLESAAEQLEYKTKDTARLSNLDYHQITGLESGKDRLKDLGSQTMNGVSVRTLMSAILFTKAIAYFRGNPMIELADLQQILPFVFYDKLQPDLESPFFEAPGNQALKSDRISWIRKLFDLSCAEFDRLNLDRDDPVMDIEKQFILGLDGLSEQEIRSRLVSIERTLSEWSKGRKLYGHIFDDILKLKYFHQRYTNYLHWLVNSSQDH